MILVEQTGIPAANWPVAEFREHLRLGTGFADDGSQDEVLERYLRSAIAAVERQIGKALLRRSFLWTLSSWRGLIREELPVAPVNSIISLRIIEPDGSAILIAASGYRLEQDAHRPALAAKGFGLPTVPVSGQIEIEFDAGFSANWSGVPGDLQQAVMLLAAHHHENRHAAAGKATAIPYGITELLAPHRPIRLFGRRS